MQVETEKISISSIWVSPCSSSGTSPHSTTLSFEYSCSGLQYSASC